MNISIIVGRFAGFTGRLVHADARGIIVEVLVFGVICTVRIDATGRELSPYEIF